MKSRVSRAVVAFAALISLLAVASPAHAEWNKGLEAYKNKDWATAVKEFEEVTKTNPDYVGGYYMLGLCQRSQNNLSAALGNLRKAVELDAAGRPVAIAAQRDDDVTPGEDKEYTDWAALADWRGLAELLLTAGGEVRKRWDANSGFAAPSEAGLTQQEKARRKLAKASITALG